MLRKNRIAIRVSSAEHDAICSLARYLNVPASTLARAMLLVQAKQHGFWSESKTASQPSQPMHNRADGWLVC